MNKQEYQKINLMLKEFGETIVAMLDKHNKEIKEMFEIEDETAKGSKAWAEVPIVCRGCGREFFVERDTNVGDQPIICPDCT